MEKKTQKERVIEYLKKYNNIDPVGAFNMGILRLSAIIKNLRDDGWNINTTYLKDKKTKKVQPYATYILKKPYKLF